MGKFIDLTGKKFGRLVVLERVPAPKKTLWKCLCECGEVTVVQAGNLRNGHTQSCGCYQLHITSVKNTKHGMSHSKLYWVYAHMVERCTNHKHKSFHIYEQKGVCKEWLDNKDSFFEWANSNGYSQELELDRIDNDKGYSPDNCRFVDKMTNIHNKTQLRRNNKSGYEGVRKTSKEGYGFNIKSLLPPLNGKSHTEHGFNTIEEAVMARNEFIKKHNLPHRVQEI